MRRQLALAWGVYPAQIEFDQDPNVTIERAEAFLREHQLAAAGDNLIIVSDSLAGKQRFETVQRRVAT